MADDKLLVEQVRHLPAPTPITTLAPDGAARQATRAEAARPDAFSEAVSRATSARARARTAATLQRSVGNARTGHLVTPPSTAAHETDVGTAEQTTAASVISETESAALSSAPFLAGSAVRSPLGSNIPVETDAVRSLPGVQRAFHEHGAGRGHGNTDSVVSSVTGVLRSSGRPLEDPFRERMEQTFQTDLSDVREHRGASAERAAAAVNARAFTVGRDIVYGAGGEDLQTRVHELTHVVKPVTTAATLIGDGINVTSPSHPGEREATENGRHVAAGRRRLVDGTDHGSGLKVSDPSDRDEQAAEEDVTRFMGAPVSEHRLAAARTGEQRSWAVRPGGEREQTLQISLHLGLVRGAPQQAKTETARDVAGPPTTIQRMTVVDLDPKDDSENPKVVEVDYRREEQHGRGAHRTANIVFVTAMKSAMMGKPLNNALDGIKELINSLKRDPFYTHSEWDEAARDKFHEKFTAAETLAKDAKEKPVHARNTVLRKLGELYMDMRNLLPGTISSHSGATKGKFKFSEGSGITSMKDAVASAPQGKRPRDAQRLGTWSNLLRA